MISSLFPKGQENFVFMRTLRMFVSMVFFTINLNGNLEKYSISSMQKFDADLCCGRCEFILTIII